MSKNMGGYPNDWNSYYTTCEHCGESYHLSEGGCFNCSGEPERTMEELAERLNAPGVQLYDLSCEVADREYNTALGGKVADGELIIVLFIAEPGEMPDEITLAGSEWAELKEMLG